MSQRYGIVKLERNHPDYRRATLIAVTTLSLEALQDLIQPDPVYGIIELYYNDEIGRPVLEMWPDARGVWVEGVVDTRGT